MTDLPDHPTAATLVAQLDEATATLRAEQATLEARLQAIRAELRPFEQARKILAGEMLIGGRTPHKTTAKAGPSAPIVSRATKDRVLAALAEHDEPLAAPELSQLHGMQRATVQAALYWLREEGRVRLTGRGSYGRKLYRPIPEAEPARAEANGAGH
jgi:response regulator of citrate/malate metabolism